MTVEEAYENVRLAVMALASCVDGDEEMESRNVMAAVGSYGLAAHVQACEKGSGQEAPVDVALGTRCGRKPRETRFTYWYCTDAEALRRDTL